MSRMRLRTPCSRIKSSGGDTSFSFFSVADNWPAVPPAEAAAMITPLFLMNSLREDLVMIFIVGFYVFLMRCLQFPKCSLPAPASAGQFTGRSLHSRIPATRYKFPRGTCEKLALFMSLVLRAFAALLFLPHQRRAATFTAIRATQLRLRLSSKS